jgi:hypothetical protein
MPGKIPTEVVTAAQAAMVKWGVPASVTIAQWAVESAWGTRMPAGSNNPFGIKSIPGEPFVIATTHEVVDGQRVQINAAFRKFDTIADAFDAHGELLATKGAYAKARLCIKDPERFANALTGVYATDPNYGRLLVSVMDSNDLYRFDKKPIPVIGPTAPAIAVLTPAAVLAVHTHSPLLPVVLGVSLALALAWVVLTILKGRTPMATSDAFNTAVANLVAAFNAKVAAASDTSALDAANAHIADLTNQLAAAQAAAAQTDADDTAAVVAATPA